MAWAANLGALIPLVAACVTERNIAELAPTYVTEVAPILASHCTSCHSDSTAAAGWRSDSYLAAISCIGASAAPATLPANAGAPILQVLDDDVHRGLLDAAQRQTLQAWIAAGAPAFRGTVHDPGIVDPRSSGFHGKVLRDRRWAPMLDASNEDACGRCHDGAPARPPGVTLAADGATSCTTCHNEPGGVLSCNTCHGQGARMYPPRDTCFFPEDAARAGAHAAHVEGSAAKAAGLSCATCHPIPGNDVISGTHGNGSVEIVFDPSQVGPEKSYDRASGSCTVSCHNQGGARPRPTWTDASAMTCRDCHGSPPAGHFAGTCDHCHRESNATGDALLATTLHLNGRVDLGDGSGQCGACHGLGDDPSPSTGAHGAHHAPTLAAPIECAVCHVMPADIFSPGHLDGVATVVFSGRAAARESLPAWNGQTCSDVACHGAGLAGAQIDQPSWTDDTGAAASCGACHGVPPPVQHTTSASCDRVECHGSEVVRTTTTLGISLDGRSLHVNGSIDVAQP